MWPSWEWNLLHCTPGSAVRRITDCTVELGYIVYYSVEPERWFKFSKISELARWAQGNLKAWRVPMGCEQDIYERIGLPFCLLNAITVLVLGEWIVEVFSSWGGLKGARSRNHMTVIMWPPEESESHYRLCECVGIPEILFKYYEYIIFSKCNE